MDILDFLIAGMPKAPSDACDFCKTAKKFSAAPKSRQMP